MPAVNADTAAAVVEGGAVAFKRGKKKLLLIVLAAALGLVLAAGSGGVWLLKKRSAEAAALAEGDEEAGAAETAQAAAKADAKSIPVYLPLDPFIINLADKDVDRYAQIGITLELESTVFADQVKAYMPAVRNAILLILAQKSSRELLGRSGKEELAEEIMREAVRPMGIEILAPVPVSVAPTVVASASGSDKTAQDEAPAKPAKKAKRAPVRNPVQHVHFSSFIIQ
jgi:flagellar protein FliL